MFAALILVISAVMLGQFVIFFWRANMLAVAAQPLSESMSAAQDAYSQALKPDDFEAAASMSKMCPSLSTSGAKLWPIRAYYQVVRAISSLSAAMPQANAWARQEMAACARYVAVSIDQRLQSNQAYAATLRTF